MEDESERKIFRQIKEELVKYKFDGKENDDTEKITRKTNLATDLGMDSLERHEATYDIGKRFGIIIPDPKINELETVGDYVRYIQNYVR